MPRNGSGTYSLPAGNPVVSGTTIQASWANSTLADISTELTGSLARSGAGGMLGALRGVDGTVSVPAFSFTSETTSGFYRAGTGDVRFAISGADIYTVTSTAVTFAVNPVLSAGTANGVMYLDGSKVVTTGSALVFDGTNLGIGTSSPGAKLHVKVGTNQNLLTTSTSSKVTNLAVDDAGSGYVDWQQYANQFIWFTASTERMLLDASGNLGIGISSPQAVLHVNKATSSTFRLSATNVGIDIQSLDGAGYGLVSTYTNHPLVFSTNASERARITSGGTLLVGLASPTFVTTRFEVEAATNNNCLGAKTTQNNYAPLMAWNSATTGDNLFQYFYTEGTLTLRGSITYNRAGGLVSYNTTSDYRAKDIIGPVQDPGATIDALKVYEGVMKGATQSRPMLIAHEAQEHVPFCVSGEKDEKNEDGSPKFQQMDHASLVPLLLAEIQSLRARVAALEAA